MTSTATEQLIPTGTWEVDAQHSNANFEVEHAGVSTFRGHVKPVDGRLVVDEQGARLEGAVRIEGLSIDDESIRPHLLSPDFFDVEKNPEVRFRSSEILATGDGVEVVGELEMAGVSRTVEATGSLRGPVEGPNGEKASLALETVIDRTDFGMDWQMELPSGGVALANEVRLVVELELNRA